MIAMCGWQKNVGKEKHFDAFALINLLKYSFRKKLYATM